ncbi:MAG TPA: prepilin-type N-terminal cleavage/methylation domain-containing protein [Bryobacteraceae bacterium]|jgi:prepilin-type N-terminal cleavage/methylation domain-containing protein
MKHPAPATAGMTLIEVMVAMLLFSFLSFGILAALRAGMTSMDHANERLMSNRRAAYAVRILESELTGFMPEAGAYQLNPQAPLQFQQFFQGEAANMRFVSSYSLQDASRGRPQILEFTVIPGENGRGVRLVVNEHLYTGPASAGVYCLGTLLDPATNIRVPLFRPITTGPGSFVLADKLAFCRFAFECPPVNQLPAVWVNHWTMPGWPLAVRVEMGPLDPDPSRLQPMTVTTAIHANKDLGMEYADTN